MRLVGRVTGVAAIALGVAALSFYAFAPGTALISCLLGWTMLAIAAVDAQRFKIPDVLSLPAIPAGLLVSGYLFDASGGRLVSLDHVIGAGLGGAGFWLVREGYYRIRGREGLGLGDVKLASAAGAWTGWHHLADVVLLAAALALGFVIAVAIIRRTGLSGTERIAFGTFLAPSIWVVWLLRVYVEGA